MLWESCQRFQVDNPNLVYGKASFRGQQFQPVGSVLTLDLFKGLRGHVLDTRLGTSSAGIFGEFLGQGKMPRSLIVPASVAEAAVSTSCAGLLTPLTVANSLKVDVSEDLQDEPAPAELLLLKRFGKSAENEGFRPQGGCNYATRQDPLMCMFYGCVGHYCQNLGDMQTIVDLVCDMFLPCLSQLFAVDFGNVEQLRTPSKDMVSYYMVKLDLLHTLS